MKKLLRSFIMLSVLFVFSACGSSKLGSATYEMAQSGVTSSMELNYDKENLVQEIHMKNIFNYEKVGATQKELKDMLDSIGENYEKIAGLTYKIEYGNSDATQTMDIIVADLSDDGLYDLYTVDTNKDGSIDLETFTKVLDEMGYTKK